MGAQRMMLQSSNSTPPLRILAVDDSPGNLSLLLETLGAEGYTVFVALNGVEAIARAAVVKPQLILLDVMMPGLDGFATCKQIKSDPALRDVPVIFMTARDEIEAIVEGLNLGAVDYLRKPVHSDELKARIAVHLQRALDVGKARAAADALGSPVIALNSTGEMAWSTPHAQRWVSKYFAGSDLQCGLPAPIAEWFAQRPPSGATPLVVQRGSARLCIAARRVEQGWLLLLSEDDPAAMAQALAGAFALTDREAEVLLWVAYGKTNREIGEILGTSPRTINKHLEHVFSKVGAETRTAAASAALRALRQSR
jgi:DNA-binding NarL/FixJ family response regulator